MNDFVYVIQADNGEVKVGLSGTPFARLSKIKREYGPRRGFKDAYFKLRHYPTRYGLLIESHAHDALEQFASGGEWYRVNSLFALGVVADVARLFQSNVLIETIGPSRAGRI